MVKVLKRNQKGESMKPSNVIGPEVSSTLFIYVKESNALVAEISDIQEDLFGPLYNDACDQGFVVRSARTGVAVPYYLASTHKDREGDITHWTFQPATRGISTYVTIYND